MVLDDSDDEIAFKVAENQVGQTLLTTANVCPKPDGDETKTIDDHEVSAATMAPAESADISLLGSLISGLGAINVSSPMAKPKVEASSSLIESDSPNLQGSKGSVQPTSPPGTHGN